MNIHGNETILEVVKRLKVLIIEIVNIKNAFRYNSMMCHDVLVMSNKKGRIGDIIMLYRRIPKSLVMCEAITWLYLERM